MQHCACCSRWAKELNIAVRFEQRAFFERIPFKAHQGVVAIAPPFPYVSLGEVIWARPNPDAPPRLFVVLYDLDDPHNVGAIVRTAEAAGANALVLPERRSAGINATVRKAAAGAAAHLPTPRLQYRRCDTDDEKRRAFGRRAPTPRLKPPSSLGRRSANRDLALVIGSEGTGLHRWSGESAIS